MLPLPLESTAAPEEAPRQMDWLAHCFTMDIEEPEDTHTRQDFNLNLNRHIHTLQETNRNYSDYSSFKKDFFFFKSPLVYI